MCSKRTKIMSWNVLKIYTDEINVWCPISYVIRTVRRTVSTTYDARHSRPNVHPISMYFCQISWHYFHLSFTVHILLQGRPMCSSTTPTLKHLIISSSSCINKEMVKTIGEIMWSVLCNDCVMYMIVLESFTVAQNLKFVKK